MSKAWSESDGVFVCQMSEVPEGEGREFVVEGREVAIWHVGDRVYATEPACPHLEGPLTAGCVDGCVVTCPIHAWMFDVRTGRCVTPAGEPPLTCYPVRLDGDAIYVRWG